MSVKKNSFLLPNTTPLIVQEMNLSTCKQMMLCKQTFKNKIMRGSYFLNLSGLRNTSYEAQIYYDVPITHTRHTPEPSLPSQHSSLSVTISYASLPPLCAAYHRSQSIIPTPQLRHNKDTHGTHTHTTQPVKGLSKWPTCRL